METLGPEQKLRLEVRPSEAMPELRILPLQQAQKQRVCNGDPKSWASSSSTRSHAWPPQAPIWTGQKHRVYNGEAEP